MLGNENINNMKVIYNKFIPFKKFYAITIIKWIFVREEYKYLDGLSVYDKMINHESIHEQQILSVLLKDDTARSFAINLFANLLSNNK